MFERAGEQPVRQPRVARQQRPMEVRPHRGADARAFVAALAVVPEPRYDSAERLGAIIQPRDTGVVLEARERPANARLELAVEEAVADHPALARDRLQRKEPRAGQLRATPAAIETAEELVPAAHRQQRRTGADSLTQSLTSRREVRSDELLLAVLAAADVEEVVLTGPQLVADTDRFDRELQPARRRPAFEDGNVAPVGVDVQVLGVEMPDADRRHAARSQYGRASPRSETIRCSASMAV
jgi:hypothetical protein